MQKKPRNGWLVLFAIYYYSIVASFNLLKVPPLFSLLMEEFGLTMANVGYIVSASSIAGMIMVLPSAFIAKRIGTYKCGMIAISCSILGCVLGALAPSLPVLLVARFIEGCGLGMTGVVGSTTIPQYFKGKKMGLPMAIWSTWFAVGSALGSLLSGKIGHGLHNWRASWWTGAILAAIGFIIFSTIVRENSSSEYAHNAKPEPLVINGKRQSDFMHGIKNIRIWLIALFLSTMLMSCVGFLAFGTEFFSTVYGMEKGDASALASIGYWSTVLGGIVSGLISRVRKSNSMRGQLIQLILCGVMSMAVYPFGFLMKQSVIIPYLLAIGFVNGFSCGVVFGTVPRMVHHPRVAGISMGVIFVFQNVSSFCASPLIGARVEGGNWSAAMLPVLLITGFGLLCCILCTIVETRRQKKAASTQALTSKEEEISLLKQEIETLNRALETSRAETQALQHDLQVLRSELAELKTMSPLKRLFWKK